MKPKPRLERPPELVRRIMILPVGVLYIVAVAAGFRAALPAPFPLALAIALLVTAVQTAIIILFSVKFLERGPHERRFSISSVLILTVYLAIFLAQIRLAVQSESLRPPELTFGVLLTIIFISTGYMIISTLILMAFAESLMWIAVSMMRSKRGQH